MRYRRLYGNKSRITFARFVLPIINASKLVQYWQSSLDRRVHQVDVPAAVYTYAYTKATTYGNMAGQGTILCAHAHAIHQRLILSRDGKTRKDPPSLPVIPTRRLCLISQSLPGPGILLPIAPVNILGLLLQRMVAAAVAVMMVTEQFVFETRRNSREVILSMGRRSCVNWRTWQYSLRDGISPVELIAVANARSKLKTDRT